MIRRVGSVLGSVVGFVVVFSAWQAVVHAEQHRTAGAVHNGLLLWSYERWLDLPSEAAIAVWTRAHPIVDSIASWYYVIAHPVVIVVTLAVVAFTGRGLYRRAFVTFGLTAIVCFLVQLWPTAPPRLLPVGAGPTSAAAAAEYHSLGSLANQVASFPSVHVAWACCVAFSLATIPRWRVAGVVHWLLTVAVVVMTANHTWLDCAAGTAAAVASSYVVTRIATARVGRRPGWKVAAAVVADGRLPVVRHGLLPVSCDECERAFSHLGGQLESGVDGGFEVPAAALRPAYAGDQDVVGRVLGARPGAAGVEDRGELYDLVAVVGHRGLLAAPVESAGVAPAGIRRGAWPKRLAVKGATGGSGTPSLDGETGRATRLPQVEARAEGATS